MDKYVFIVFCLGTVQCKNTREKEAESGKGSEAAQYDPERFDCRLYPVIPLVRGNMCRTCVPLRSLHNQEDTAERKAA